MVSGGCGGGGEDTIGQHYFIMQSFEASDYHQLEQDVRQAHKTNINTITIFLTKYGARLVYEYPHNTNKRQNMLVNAMFLETGSSKNLNYK